MIILTSEEFINVYTLFNLLFYFFRHYYWCEQEYDKEDLVSKKQRKGGKWWRLGQFVLQEIRYYQKTNC